MGLQSWQTEPHDNRDFALCPSLAGDLPCALLSAATAVCDHEEDAGGQDPVSRMVEQKDGEPGSPRTVLSRRPDPSNYHRLSSFAEISNPPAAALRAELDARCRQT